MGTAPDRDYDKPRDAVQVMDLALEFAKIVALLAGIWLFVVVVFA